MKSLKTAVLVLACLGCGVGCATTETERAASDTARGAEALQRRISMMPTMIDNTMIPLVSATSPDSANTQTAFNQFGFSLREMRERATQIGKDYERARANSDRFFEEWRATGRTLSPEERAQLEEDIGGRISSRDEGIRYFEEAQSTYLNLVENLESLRSSLAGNLTPENIQSLSPQVERAVRDAYDVRLYVERLDEVLTRAANLRG